MKRFPTLAVAALALTGAYASIPYRVIVPMNEAEPGTKVYLLNYDTHQIVDSALVADNQVVFSGDIDEPWIGRIVSNGNRLCTFIVEEGTVSINREKKEAVGMMYNDMLNTYGDSINAYENLVSQTSPENYDAVIRQVLDFIKKTVAENEDNPVGIMAFLDYASIVDAEDLLAAIDEYPALSRSNRINELKESAMRKRATSAGQPMVDFEVEYNGNTERLSDYVGKGKYTLVDFWASWCGPCIREMSTLKEIYNTYGRDQLDVLGVAVWDEPENTLAAIQRHNIPWHSMLNTQTIATDAYGIPAIPCIILFGPDGTIISRDARGEQLKAIVAAQLNAR